MEEIVIKLKTFRNSEFPILTVYLSSTEKRPPQASYYLSQLHSLVHKSLNDEQQRFWQEDIDKIEHYLHQSLDRSNTRSLVFFSAGENLWEVLKTEFSIPLVLKTSHSPYLRPLQTALTIYQKYLVLLVDRKKARLLIVHLGMIEEHKDVFNGEVPQRVKAKKIDYGRDNKIPNHIEDHLHRHLQFVTHSTREFIKGKNIHFIILGSHKDLLPKIKAHLVYPLSKMVLGEFVTELNIPLNEVLHISKKVAMKINQKLTYVST